MMKRILLVRRVMISARLLVRQAMAQNPPPSPLLRKGAVTSGGPVPWHDGAQGARAWIAPPPPSLGKGKAQERQGDLHRIQSDATTPDVAKTTLAVHRCTLSTCDCQV